MPATQTLERIRIFCASPGDVDGERQVVEEVVGLLDQIWRDRGVTLEFHGWSDRGPSAGPPQADINPLVDECDVLIGLLNARWGFPTGEYESGFEEEYERALARNRETKAPELCIWFSANPSRGPQAHLVEAFRMRLESSGEAYYRTFEDADDLRVQVQRRLEAYLTERLKLGASEERPASLDWAQLLQKGPISHLQDGVARKAQAAALAEEDPAHAGEILEQLASELASSASDFEPTVETLRREAADLYHRSGQSRRALELVLSIVRVLAGARTPALRGTAWRLTEWLPSESRWIASAWEALAVWPERRKGAVDALRTALSAEDDPDDLVTQEDREVWREELAEILLWGDSPTEGLEVVKDLPALSPSAGEVLVRLHCLAAEGAALTGEDAGEDGSADRWDALLTWVDEHAGDRPEICAIVRARQAIGLVRDGRLAGAQRGFHAAAELWSKVEHAAGEVGEQHFSASIAASLLGDFFAEEGTARAQAAQLQSVARMPGEIAERLIREGLETRLTGHASDAMNQFALATHVHRRAGHLRGEMHATRLLAELYEHVGEHSAALALSIRHGSRDAAERLAVQVEPAALLDSLNLDGPSWMRAPSLAALGAAGRRLRSEQVDQIAPWVVRASRESGTMPKRDRQVAGVRAAAALVFEWPSSGYGEVEELLRSAVTSRDWLIAIPAARALELLTNVHRGDYAELLAELMVGPLGVNGVQPAWLASHLATHPELVPRLEEAAAAGDFAALETLCLREKELALGEEVTAALERRIETFLSSEIGHTAEGHVIGFLRLEPWGTIGRWARDGALRESLGGALIEFATNDEEPHANRASAANALHNLAPALSGGRARDCLARLRPIVEGHFGSSVFDLPPAVANHPFNKHRFGDEAAADRLQAAALTACARLADHAGVELSEASWLTDAIESASMANEPVIIASAWASLWRWNDVPLPDTLTAHLLHPADEVREAALLCWRMRREDAPPTRVVGRLAQDESVGVRLTLVGLLRDGDRNPRALGRIAASDADAYVRAAAAGAA